MITILLALAVGFAGFSMAYWCADWGTGWSVACGVAGFAVFQIAAGVFFRKRVARDMEKVQSILADGQKRIQAKVQRWQFRPQGSVQAMQKEIEADTRQFVKEALAATEALRRYRFWIPAILRQMATAQLQLNWMVKDFKKVDELMPKALFLDPSMTAMRLARMQMTGADVPAMAKVYAKGTARLRYNQNTLLAACWSWILVERGMADEAFKVLTEALKHGDNDTLKANHAHLMNNRLSHFSNAGLGDQWYSLQLEEPRIRTQRQRPVYR